MADQTLIQGAGAAAESKFAGKLAGSKMVAGITKGLGDISTGYFQEKAFQQKQYDVMAQKVLEEAGDLSSELKSEIYDDLQKGRYDYVYGDKKSKMLSIENLNKKARTYAEFMDTRLELAELMEDEDALNNYFKNSGNYDDYLDLLKPGARLVNNKDGEAGYEIGGEWKSLSQIKSTIKKEGTRDDMFEEKLGKLLDNYTQMSAQVSDGQDMLFPQQAALNMVKKNLIGASSNLNSIAYDDFFGGTSFYEDLVEGLQGTEYKNLGIEDPTSDTGITAEDANVIAKELINNPDNRDLFVDEISKYYTKFLKQNWNDGEQFRMRAKEGYVRTNDPFPLFQVNTDENELSGNKTKTGSDDVDPPSSPYPNMNMDLVKSVQAGDNKFPELKKQDIRSGKKQVAKQLNSIFGPYGFTTTVVKTMNPFAAQEVIVSHVGKGERRFKVSSGNVKNLQEQYEDIKSWIEEQSKIQVNWDEYNETYGLEVEE
tara:strand:- start:336 stop:1784 length:1449 start_codon:yes stop_codon:yes gene_type:complete